MDNQQALTDKEIGWLCGFFDGEGNVGMHVTTNASFLKGMNTKRHTVMVPRLIVANTDFATMMYFKELCDKIPVGVHLWTQSRNNPKHRPCLKATINGFKRCSKIIPILMKDCITKKAQLKVLNRWLDHRQENYHYDLRDYEYLKEFAAISNGNGPNDLTLRRLYESCTADIYSSEIRGVR